MSWIGSGWRPAPEADFIDPEERSERETKQLHAKYAELAAAAKKVVEKRARQPKVESR